MASSPKGNDILYCIHLYAHLSTFPLPRREGQLQWASVDPKKVWAFTAEDIFVVQSVLVVHSEKPKE